MKTVFFVIPCYNEEEVLPITSRKILDKVTSLIASSVLSPDSRIFFVDDGSRDRTWSLIRQYHLENPLFSGLKLSRNRGHQNALLAGLLTVRDQADAVISMDADMQDDIDAIDRFIQAFSEGADVVYGVRQERKTDTAFKRLTALGFYRLMARMGVDSVYNHADYRLMSRRALAALATFRETNLFLRGIVPLVGFPSAQVMYNRSERAAGVSKYPLRKMLNFAIDGITSFSVKPLRMISALGIIISLVSVIAMVYALVSKLVGAAVQGWTATLISIWLLGGLQMLSLGVCGEYIGKVYNEVKDRPRFIVEECLLPERQQAGRA